jgi:hypothetical protein
MRHPHILCALWKQISQFSTRIDADQMDNSATDGPVYAHIALGHLYRFIE